MSRVKILDWSAKVLPFMVMHVACRVQLQNVFAFSFHSAGVKSRSCFLCHLILIM